MANSFIKKQLSTTNLNPLKTVLLSTLACVALTACDNDGITHVNTAFDRNWEEIARSQGKLKDEMSHLAPERYENLPSPDTKAPNTQMIDEAPIADMVAPSETVDIIPQNVAPAPSITTTPPVVTEPQRAPILQMAENNAPRSNLNPKNMFGTDLSSNEARLDRLERAVQDMRNDFSRVEPSVQRLMFLENDIQTLIRELEKLNTGATPTSKNRATNRRANKTNVADDIIREDVQQRNTAAPAPARATPASQKSFVKKSAPTLSGQPSIFDIRIGEHSDKTRIVMDVNSKASFNADIDNSENIMIVDLPNTQWNARMAQSFAKSPNIKSFSVEKSGDGHLVIFQLKRNARIAYKGDLKGVEGASRRLVIDVSGS